MSDKQLHELYGEEYLIAAFDAWVKKNNLTSVLEASNTREKYFLIFRSAFNEGVTAHANGNYY